MNAWIDLTKRAVEIWISGGWGMIALTINGFVMYGLGMMILVDLWAKGVFSSAERVWEKWHAAGGGQSGTLYRVIEGSMDCRSTDEVIRYFDGVRSEEISPFDRNLKVMKVSVASAPLLGLLGTVTGMLTTFSALATGGGGDKTMGMIAKGISEALITTESGLVLALSGLMMQFMLTRQHEKYAGLLMHLETLCTEHCKKKCSL